LVHPHVSTWVMPSMQCNALLGKTDHAQVRETPTI
jgi:hypothetical protein